MEVKMRFDYYAATLPAQLSYCEKSIKDNFEGYLISEPPVKPYKSGLRHHQKDFRLYWGGQNPLPFFVASGQNSEDAASFVRRVFPQHRVSRADVAVDFEEVGGFDRVHALINPICRNARVEVEFQGDPDPTQKRGRTMYYGSKNSDVRICLYEKGLHELGKGNLEASEGWVRIELRVRPRKQRKALCASFSPQQFWGCAKWTSIVSKEVLLTVVPFEPDPSLRLGKVDQAVIHMFRQYAGSIRAFCDKHGKFAFLDHVDDVLQVDEETRMRIDKIANDLTVSECLNSLKNMGFRLEAARARGQGARAAEIASEIKILRQKIEAFYAT
jgi:hypothetical protein